MDSIFFTHMINSQIDRVIPHRNEMKRIDQVVFVRNPTEEADNTSPHIHARMYAEPSSTFFKGHFEGNPILPGVITLEAMAQAAAFHWGYFNPNSGKLPVFKEANQINWKGMVVPGDVVDLFATRIHMVDNRRMTLVKYQVYAFVGPQLVADGVITAIGVPKEKIPRLDEGRQGDLFEN